MASMYAYFPRKKKSWDPTDNLMDGYVDKMWITFEISVLICINTLLHKYPRKDR